MSALKINLGQAKTFLQAYEETLVITFQIFDDRKQSRRAQHFTADFNDPKCVEYLTQANNEGCGIYFMCAEGDGAGRSNANVVALRSLVVDLDGAPLEPVLECPLEPHFIVESSKGRYQAHFLIDPVLISSFDSPDDAKQRFAALQVALARKFHGDESVKDLARVFRVPGFWHQKGTPFQCTIIHESGGLPYDLDHVVTTLGLNEAVEKVKTELKEPLGEVDQLLSSRIKAGNRHATLLAYASKYAHQYRLGYNERKWLLEGLNRHACETPIESKDLERINLQAGKYAAEERAKVETVDISALLAKHRVISEKPQDALPEFLYNPPGLVGDVMRYILATAIKPQPEHALAAALVACGTVMGRKVRSETNVRTNLYCMTLMETGAGKDWPRKAIMKIFGEIGVAKRAAVEEIASDAAISEILVQSPSQVFLLDEFGKLLRNIASKNAGTHLTAILPLLMKLYSSANAAFHAKAYADTKQNKVIQQPNVSLLMTSVERSVYKALTKEAVDDGLLNRMLLFQSTEPDPPMRKVENFDPPQSLLDQFAAWESLPYRQDGGNLGDVETGETMQPQPRIVPFAEGAEEVFGDMERDLRQYRKDLRKEGMAGLFTRCYENAIKVALILACGQNIEAPMITVDDAEYACTLVLTLTKSLYRAVNRNVSDSRIEANHKALLGAIREAGPDGLTRKKLCWKGRDIGLTRRERDDILKDLIEWGTIVSQEVKGPTKSTTKFFYLGDEIVEKIVEN